MEFEAKKKSEIQDGIHYGTIRGVVESEGKYNYVDIFVQVDETSAELKYGCPPNLTEGSKLHKLLSEFVKIEVGKNYNPETILLGKRVSFITMKERQGDKEYSRIVSGSVHPAQDKKEVK